MTLMIADSIIKKALEARALEEKLLELYHQGKIFGTVHTCVGQELIGAIFGTHMQDVDLAFSNHRGHGHFIGITGETEKLLAEVMGKVGGVCKGMGGSQHLHYKNFYSNGIQGGIVPVAAGMSLAEKLSQSNGIVVCFIGDGTLGEGAVYEALNICAKWKLPILYVVEDNEIAQSTSSELTQAGTVQGRAEAFGIEFFSGDTWSWEKLSETVELAINFVRTKVRPAVFHIKTFRLNAHSKGDDTRELEIIERAREKDPINQLLKNSEVAEKFRLIRGAVDKMAERCLSQPELSLDFQKDSIQENWQTIENKNETFGNLLNQALGSALQASQRTIFLGEDILSPYGGAFKIAKGLSQKYPNQVFTTPISEAAIVGLATGLALRGYTAIAEIMFGDFLGLTFDQIVNHAAKFKEMYQASWGFRLMIRTPMGGYRGYGPTHSQSLEKHFLGIPNCHVLAANSLIDPQLIFGGFMRGEGLHLLIENKRIYSNGLSNAPSGFDLYQSMGEFPSAYVKPRGKKAHLTLLSHGGAVDLCLEAIEKLFLEHDILAELLALTELYPLNLDRYSEILKNSSAIMVVEEGQGFCGLGSEIGAQLIQNRWAGKDLRFQRIASQETIIPAASQLEKLVLPSVNGIIEAAKELIR